MVVSDHKIAIDIRDWLIYGGGRLKRFYWTGSCGQDGEMGEPRWCNG